MDILELQHIGAPSITIVRGSSAHLTVNLLHYRNTLCWNPLHVAQVGSRKFIRRLLIILPISVVVSVAFAYFTTDAQDLHRLSLFSLRYLFLAAGLRLIPWITKSLRLLNWMSFRNHKFTFWDALRVTMMSELGAIVSPTSVGGEPVKVGMLYERGLALGEATSLTTVAAIEDITVYLFALPVALLLAMRVDRSSLDQVDLPQLTDSWWILAVIGAAILVIVIVALVVSTVPSLVSVRRRIKRFWREFKRVYVLVIRKGKRRFAFNVLMALIHWCARYSVVAALALSLGFQVDWVRFFVLQWLVFAVMMLVPTPGATGGAEGAFLLLFSSVLPRQSLGTIMIGWRFIDFYFMAILAIAILGLQGLVARVSGPSAVGPTEQTRPKSRTGGTPKQ